jgi:hypothetical protein
VYNTKLALRCDNMKHVSISGRAGGCRCGDEVGIVAPRFECGVACGRPRKPRRRRAAAARARQHVPALRRPQKRRRRTRGAPGAPSFAQQSRDLLEMPLLLLLLQPSLRGLLMQLLLPLPFLVIANLVAFLFLICPEAGILVYWLT